MGNALQGRHALVTGGGRGIGAAIARRLLADGASVTLLGREQAGLDATVHALQSCVTEGAALGAVSADITDADWVSGAFAGATEARGPITLLVNNAGQAHSAPFGKTDLALWQRMLEVNLTGTFICTQAALPAMLEAGWGRIVNVASTAGLIGYGYVSAYCAAKHGVIGLTRSLAREFAASGIRINAVAPGPIATAMVSAENMSAEWMAKELDIPMARLGTPDEVAAAIVFLLSPQASYFTGQILGPNGGSWMGA